MRAGRARGQRARYLRLDPIACDGYGLCAELLPELVTLDDWGYPIIAAKELEGDLMKEAEAVVSICPKLALRLGPLPSAPTREGRSSQALNVARGKFGHRPTFPAGHLP